MSDHSENTHVARPPSGQSGASRAFPENQEPKGKKIFGPAPSKPQPSVGNVFNTDKHGRRVPRDT